MTENLVAVECKDDGTYNTENTDEDRRSRGRGGAGVQSVKSTTHMLGLTDLDDKIEEIIKNYKPGTTIKFRDNVKIDSDNYEISAVGATVVPP